MAKLEPMSRGNLHPILNYQAGLTKSTQICLPGAPGSAMTQDNQLGRPAGCFGSTTTPVFRKIGLPWRHSRHSAPQLPSLSPCLIFFLSTLWCPNKSPQQEPNEYEMWGVGGSGRDTVTHFWGSIHRDVTVKSPGSGAYCLGESWHHHPRVAQSPQMPWPLGASFTPVNWKHSASCIF